MSNLTALANHFFMLIKQADPMKDPLVRSEKVLPEVTEEIDDLIKDSLQLVILLHRAFADFSNEAQNLAGDDKYLATKLSEQVISELDEIEDTLQSPHLLEFDLNTESTLIDSLDSSLSMIRMALNLVKPVPVPAPHYYSEYEKVRWEGKAPPPAFKALDPKVHKWVSELQENFDKMHDLAMRQSEFMERYFASKPIRMTEQEEKNPDEFSYEDIHPDYDDGPEYFSDEAAWNEIEDDEALAKRLELEEQAEKEDW